MGLDAETLKQLEQEYDEDDLYRVIEERYGAPNIVKSGRVRDTDVTIVGVHHDGEQSRRLVHRVIQDKKPDLVGVELTPLAMLASKLFGHIGSRSELVVAAHEARDVGAHAVAIDKNRPRLLIRALIRYPSFLLLGFLMAYITVAMVFSLVFFQSVIQFVSNPLLASAFALATLTSLILMRFPFVANMKQHDFGRLQYTFVKEKSDEFDFEEPEFVRTVVGDWREAHMQQRVEKLTSAADNIVIVVGASHVDPLAERFGGTWEPQPSYFETHEANES